VQILLVEDNDINALLVKRLISKWGGVVVHAKNGREAVSLAEANRFDLILMDCQMPVMDGFEATRIIRAGAGKSKAASIIALTANALEESRKMCEAAGMNDFVAKPIDAAQLKVVIQSWLKV
jgi:CheY-like chemotaxis protein